MFHTTFFLLPTNERLWPLLPTVVSQFVVIVRPPSASPPFNLSFVVSLFWIVSWIICYHCVTQIYCRCYCVVPEQRFPSWRKFSHNIELMDIILIFCQWLKYEGMLIPLVLIFPENSLDKFLEDFLKTISEKFLRNFWIKSWIVHKESPRGISEKIFWRIYAGNLFPSFMQESMERS